MHELSLAQNILEAVKDLRDAAGRKPSAVVVKIGPFANVTRLALEFGFDASKAAFGLEGCRLVFEEVPARLRCAPCAKTFDFKQSFDCPACGAPALEILSGREFLIDAAEFPDDPAGEGAAGQAEKAPPATEVP